MTDFLDIKQGIETPKYKQIQDAIFQHIETGSIRKGDKLPSINHLASEHHLARETVVKAFSNLKRKGIIDSVHGKGYFIISTEIQQEHRIFLLFDTLTAYKEVLFHSIKKAFDDTALLDIYFHHFNIKVFENLVRDHNNSYTEYLILPFEHPDMARILDLIPYNKLYIIDRYPKSDPNKYKGVYQDFENDIYNSLKSTGERINQYKKFYFVFRNTITEPPVELINGFTRFAIEQNLDNEIIKELPDGAIQNNSAYLVIDDADLVSLVTYARAKNLLIGKDIGIISYNDTSLKKVVGNGISVISTDFKTMGEHIVKLIKNKSDSYFSNPCKFIDRGSF